jgi:L-iditol 2-dehydrogenase
VGRDVEADVAAIAEPLAVCVRAIHLARIEPGSRVLVIGAGSIGLLSGMLARDPASEVAVTARHPQQREAAERLGLTALTEADASTWAADRAPDVVIETVGGAADTLEQSVQACRPGGRVVVLGVFAGSRSIDALGLMAKEITVIGSNTYGTGPRGPEFRVAVDLLPRYAAEIAPLQTHRFDLAQVEDAFACAADKSKGAIKVTVQVA